ncbi:MAG: DUF2946 family protein, partial [Xanthomonadaceae bacterium]|nr:DUF2946 family protein [Xanthomonadaceae bacterium]
MILRSTRFQHWMARLALAAILLLSVMPSVSRWLESTAPRLPDAVLAMCTLDGLAMKPASLFSEPGKPPAPSGAIPDGYCGYCPLLASLTPLLLAVIILLPPLRRVPLPAWAQPALRAVPLLRGLGA